MPVPQPPSSLWIAPYVRDGVVVQDATYRFTNVDRTYIDSQIQALEYHVIGSLIGGAVCTWCQLDPSSAAVTKGSAVCLANVVAQTVTLATASTLSAAGQVFGVVVSPASPGGYVQVAMAGVLPTSITGLPTSGNNVYAKVNTSTGVIVTAASLSGSDYPIGTVTPSGNLNIHPQFTPLAGASVASSIFVNANTTLTNANSGQAVKTDTTGGTLTQILLPNITTDDTEFLLIDATTQWGAHNLSISTPGGTNAIRDPNLLSGGTSTTVTLKNAGQSVKWKADLARLTYQLV